MTSTYELLFYSLSLAFCCIILRRYLRPSPYEAIPGPTPSSALVGYLPDIHDRHGLEMHHQMIERYGHVARLKGGLLTSDALYIADPLALRTILINEQENFRESTEFAGLFGIIHRGDGLASVWGSEHRKQRKLLNPVFGASNVSKLLPVFYQIADELRTRIIRDIKTMPSKESQVDILDHVNRAALEFVGRGGIGHAFNMLKSNDDTFIDFYDALRNVLPLASKLFLVFPFFDSMRKMKPVWLRRFLAGVVNYIPWSAARSFKAAVEAMHPVYVSILTRGKRELLMGTSDHTTVKDLTTLLIHANAQADEEDQMSDQVIMANISSIVHGGQETTSTMLARFIHMLSIDQHLQEQLRTEILQALEANNNKPLDYAELNALPLLDGVCREALRYYAPVPFVWRQTMKDTVMPLQYPIKCKPSGTDLTNKTLSIKKGTSVYLGLSAANRSRAIWGDHADTFSIERWASSQSGGLEGWEADKMGWEKDGRPCEMKKSVKLPGIYSNIMTFLGGGRACPGMKFAILEIKVVLITLLSTFSFSNVEGMDVDWQLGITLTPYVKGKKMDGARVPVGISKLDDKEL